MRASCGALQGIILSAAAAAAAPQDASGDPSVTDESIQEIVVTGSRIPRRDFVTPSPFTTIDAVELRRSGTTNLEDALDGLPQVVPGFDRTANDPGRGQATVNLRGLGEKRTLVLLNGRRFISSATDGVVDINNIPSALVERIEVITGGASAVYGSDALAGAVNFILKKSFEGIEVNAQYDITAEDDGQVLDFNLSGGTPLAGGRGHLSGFLGYDDRDGILRADRSHSAQTRAEDFLTGEVFVGGSPFVPEGYIPTPVDIDGVPAPDGVIFKPDGTPRPFDPVADLFDFGPFNYLQTPLERRNAAGFLTWDLGDRTEVYSDLLYSANLSTMQLAPTFNPGSIRMNLDNPFVTPETRRILEDFFDPDANGIAEFLLARRLLELGPRRTVNDSELTRVIAGATGELSDDYTWNVHYLWSTVDFVTTFDNNASQANIRQAMLVDPDTGQCFDPGNGCAPANFFGAGNLSPEAAEFIRTVPVVQSTHNEQRVLNGSLVGDLPWMFADAIGFALGVEYRSEQISFEPDPALATGDIVSLFPSPPVEGSFSMREAFAELRVPVLEDRPLARELGLEVGYRYTDHSISGDFGTWKIAANWRPVGGLVIRASAQEAVRAPNSLELFEGVFTEQDPFIWQVDLCSASSDPVALGIADVCVAQGIPAEQIGVYEATPFFLTEVITGGNRNLEPEMSDTVTAGVVFWPDSARNISISLDYYSIRVDNAIQGIAPSQIPIECFAVKDPADELCQAVERTDPTFNITRVIAGPRNIARIETEGYDLQIDYQVRLPDWLSLSAGDTTLHIWFLGNRTTKNGSQMSPSVPSLECAGLFAFPCDTNSFGSLPEHRTTTRFTYESGPLALSLRWNWIDHMDSACLEYCPRLFGVPQSALMLNVPEVSSEQYFDLSFDYRLNDAWRIYGGIHNLTDEDPPWLGGVSVQANTDPSLYDVLGRRFFLGVNASLQL